MKYHQNNTKLDYKHSGERACLESLEGTLLAMSVVTTDTQGNPVSCCEPTMFVADLEPWQGHRLIVKHLWSAGYDTRVA